MYILFNFLLLFTSIHALYEKSKHVVSLTNETFDKTVINNADPWIVNFYAPWCKHCIRFVDEYDALAKQLKGVFHFGAVDVTEYKDLKKRFKVRRFPTLLIFQDDKTKPKEYTGYKDQRSIAMSLIQGTY